MKRRRVNKALKYPKKIQNLDYFILTKESLINKITHKMNKLHITDIRAVVNLIHMFVKMKSETLGDIVIDNFGILTIAAHENEIVQELIMFPAMYKLYNEKKKKLFKLAKIRTAFLLHKRKMRKLTLQRREDDKKRRKNLKIELMKKAINNPSK